MGTNNPERVFGKRIVNYLKNEALIGRIGRQKIQTLSSTLGLSAQLKDSLAALEDEDSGANRSLAMGGLLSEWVGLSGPTTLQPDALGLATALDSARLSYHGKEVRAMDSAALPATFETGKPLVMHSPAASPQLSSPKKLTNFSESVKSVSKERAANSQSDSGVFTSDSSKENEEKEEKKGKGKPRRIVKRKLISYRVKPKRSETEQLESTDGSLDLKEKQPELPPVKTKHKLQLKERQNFQSPRTPQKLPSINSEARGGRRGETSRLSNKRVAKSTDKLTRQTEKKFESNKSSEGPAELISNERRQNIAAHSSTLRPLTKQTKRLSARRQQQEERGKETPGQRAGDRQPTSRRKRSFSKRKSQDQPGAPDTADTVILDVRRSKSQTNISTKNSNSDEEDLSRSASISKIPSSRQKSRERRQILKKGVVAQKTEEETHHLEAEDKVLTLLKLDETFTRDNFGNKQFSASSNSPRSLARTKSKISIRSSASIRSDSSKSLSSSSRSNDFIAEGIESIMEKKNFVNRNSLPELIRRKARSDRYIRSLCQCDDWFRVNYLSALIMFGPRLKLNSRSQVTVWVILCRLGQYWSDNLKTPPTEEDLLNDWPTMRFVLNLCKLCYNLVKTDQVQVTAVQEVKVKDDSSESVLVFEQFGVSLPRLRLTNFEIAVFQEKNPFNDHLGHFVECNFFDRPLVEFLASIHVHVHDEDIGDLSQSDLAVMLPILCGISSQSKEKEQNLVKNFVTTLVSSPVQKEPEYYLHKKQLQDVWMNQETPLLLFSAIYEARLKSVHDKHPTSETELNFFETQLELHHLVTISHYLSQVDRKHVRINTFSAKNCGLNNDSLSLLAEKLWRMKSVILSSNKFSEKGIGQLVNVVEKKEREENNFSLDLLDLSNCNLDDAALERVAVLTDFVKELILTDNNFTSPGIRALAKAHSTSSKLKKLDMSRTNIGKSGFYELIPVLLNTEQVTLQGNDLSPLELKEFATKLKEEESPKIKILDISSTSLSNESMPQISNFINLIESLDLHNSDFSPESMKTLVTAIEEKGIGKLKTLNLRLCKLNDACLEILSEIIPKIISINLSSNNFSGNLAVKTLCTKIERTEKASLKFLDMKYSRLSQDMKKSLGEVCRNKNIELKVW